MVALSTHAHNSRLRVDCVPALFIEIRSIQYCCKIATICVHCTVYSALVLTMASDDSPERRTVLEFNDKLTSALSTDPLSIAGTLVAKGFISSEIQAEMLLDKTPTVKATILIEAVRKKIEIAPGKFEEFLHILSDQSWTKEIAEALRSECLRLVHTL